MGKLKRGRKNQKARLNPIGNKNGGDDKRDETTRQSKILPLINKLASSVPNDRSMALGAITVLAEDTRLRQMLLKEKLVSIIMEQCLNDTNDEIVVESFGLLRNLGIEEGYDVLMYYWRQNIWTTIESSLNKIETSFKYLLEQQQQPQDKSKVSLLYDFTENIISLIIVLASGSEELYQSIFEKIDPILTFAVSLINHQVSNPNVKIGSKLFNGLLEFIYEFSTESDEFVKKMINQESFNIASIEKYSLQNSNGLSQIYIEGIKFNVEESSPNKEERSQVILNQIYVILSLINLNDIKEALKTQDNAKPVQREDGSLVKELNKNNSAKADLNTLEVALDLITSILEYLSVNESSTDESINLSPGLLDLLLSKVYQILTELLKYEIENHGTIMLMDKILISLNNLVWLMNSNEHLPTEWYEKCISLWDTLIVLAGKSDVKTQTNCLNNLWGLSKALGPEVRSKVTPEMVSGLINLARGLPKTDENLQLYLSIVGFLGNLAPIIGNTTLTSDIANFLVESIVSAKDTQNPTEIELAIEAVNLIFAIFGDKEYEYDYEVFVQQNFLDKLVELEAIVKAIYKKIDKNKEKQLKVRGEEAWLNLGRFIQYKQSEY